MLTAKNLDENPRKMILSEWNHYHELQLSIVRNKNNPECAKGLSSLISDTFMKDEMRKQEIKKEEKRMNDYRKMELIMYATIDVMKISMSILMSNRRTRVHVDARSMVFFITRYTTKLSLKQIGKHISVTPKDHSTIIHGTEHCYNLLSIFNINFTRTFNEIKHKLEYDHAITFDLSDEETQPDWYKRLKAK